MIYDLDLQAFSEKKKSSFIIHSFLLIYVYLMSILC